MEFHEQRKEPFAFKPLDDGVATVAVVPSHDRSLSPRERLLEWAIADQAEVVADLCAWLTVEVEQFEALLRTEIRIPIERGEDQELKREDGEGPEVMRTRGVW